MTQQEFEELMEKMREEYEKLGAVSNKTANNLLKLQKEAELTPKEIAANRKALREHSEEVEKAMARLEAGGRLFDIFEKAITSNTAAMYEGKQGAAVFNESIRAMADALNLIILLIPGLGIAAKVAATAINLMSKSAEAAMKQSDALYKSYQGLAASGAAASDGMQGIFRDMQKFGMGIEELDQFVELINNNSKTLAQFAGTVGQGRNALADISKGIVRSQLGRNLELMGFSIKDINEGIAGYVALQTQIGRAQKMSNEQLSQSAAAYLKEMDALSKVTGIQRKDMEAEMDRARSEQRFRAKLDEMRASGDKRQIAAADQLERANAVLAKQAPQLAQGFRDASAGYISSEAAQKFYLSTQGKGTQTLSQLTAGNIQATQALQQVYQAAGQTAENFRPLAKAGAMDAIGDYAELSNLGVRAQTDLNQAVKDAEKQINGQVKATDPLVEAQVDLRREQRAARDSLQSFIQKGVLPATQAALALAKAQNAAAKALDDAAGAEGNLLDKAAAGLESAVTSLAPGLASTMNKLGEKLGMAPSPGQKQAAEGKPAAPPSPGMGGRGSGAPPAPLGPGKQTSTQQLKDMGLILKQGDVQADGSVIQNKTLELAKRVQEGVKGFAYFSGFNDKFHQEKAPSSQHTQGNAFDFVLNYRPTPEQGKEIANFIGSMGARMVIDEYNNPSSKSTAPHFHVQAMAKGGITDGISIAGEAGPEAVVPLPDGRTIPVEITNANYQAPTRDQLLRAHGDLIQQQLELIPGLKPSSQYGWAIESGSIAHKLTMAVQEMTKNGTDPRYALKPGEKRDFYDFVRMMLTTPEGKVWGAENYIGVDAKGMDSPESQRLREQYTRITEEIRLQNIAAANVGKNVGAALEDPLSRMEVLSTDYIRRQTDRIASGMGDFQTGAGGGPRLAVINEQVLQELKNIKDGLDKPKMAEGGITDGPSIAGEAGPEAVVPLSGGRVIPVEMVGLKQSLDDLIDLMRRQNQTSEKILQVSRA
jgi:hypothetical protein